MEHLEFQAALNDELKNIVIPLTEQYKKYTVEFDNVRHNTYLTVKTGESMIKVLLYQSGDVSYIMWDCLCIGGTELFYYKYDSDDEHTKIVEKFGKDFKQFLAMYFKNPSIHDLTELEITYDSDNKEAFDEYEEISMVN